VELAWSGHVEDGFSVVLLKSALVIAIHSQQRKKNKFHIARQTQKAEKFLGVSRTGNLQFVGARGAITIHGSEETGHD
jgi:hypothetical protein